jgi:4-hydroxybenzoate polyprenyltransferase
MGARTADGVAPRRSKARAYLVLARPSNLPTIWTNVAAAYIVAGAPMDSFPVAAAAVSLLYCAGMFFNDVADARFDAVARADRPIVSGEVSRPEAAIVGGFLMVDALVLLALLPSPALAMAWSFALIAAILFYDFNHKGKWYGPLVMGLCRALVYAVAAAGAVGVASADVMIAAAVMWLYVIALTQAAKTTGRGYLVPWLIAGICIVDAIMIALAGAPLAAAVAAGGFVATLLLQRIVPGT